MFERYSIKVAQCAGGVIDVSRLPKKLSITKRIKNDGIDTAMVTFSDTDISVTGVEGCGNLVVRPVGLTSQKATTASTSEGKKLITGGKIGAYNILEHKQAKYGDSVGGKQAVKHTVQVFTNNVHFIG